MPKLPPVQDPEIRRRDRDVFVEELVRPPTSVLVALVAVPFISMGFGVAWWLGLAGLGAAAWHGWSAFQRSVSKRFRHRRFKYLWESCEDRLRRLHEGMDRLRGAKIAELTELPRTISGTAEALYLALRRADNALDEIQRSEGWRISQVDQPAPLAQDAQAAKLWQAATEATGEYRKLLAGLTGSIERTEAQAALFTATLDTLRVKMLGHRLVGRAVEAESLEFMQALTEARMQLDAIDKALDELEMTPFPKQVAVMSDPRQVLDREDWEKEPDLPAAASDSETEEIREENR
ncbi:MAG: hypothetical protein MH204_01750 [Fimbriimonadaceae bacterium]|nr:hypothetical protein [Fimbriimonadaceae bacterium]